MPDTCPPRAHRRTGARFADAYALPERPEPPLSTVTPLLHLLVRELKHVSSHGWTDRMKRVDLFRRFLGAMLIPAVVLAVGLLGGKLFTSHGELALDVVALVFAGVGMVVGFLNFPAPVRRGVRGIVLALTYVPVMLVLLFYWASAVIPCCIETHSDRPQRGTSEA